METNVDTSDAGNAVDDAPEEPVVLTKAKRPAAADAPAGDGPAADDPRFLPAHLDPTAPTVLPPLPPIEHSRGWRRTLLRTFVVLLLLAGLATTGFAVSLVLDEAKSDEPGGRRAVNGVLMPDDTRFREVANELLRRKRPQKVTGMTVVGAAGVVTVIPYERGRTSFLSSYMNPNALQVIARAIGVRSDEPIVVEQMRLEVLRRTGRQRWRLAGTQGGRPWRATINPNGTNFRVVPARKG